MKRLLSVGVLLLSLTSFAGNNDIYLTQTGTGLTLTIDQIGATNKVGTSQARVTLSGTSMTVDLDQIGDTNTFAATIAQGNSSSFTYKATGDSNTAAITVGGTGDAASTDFDFEAWDKESKPLFRENVECLNTKLINFFIGNIMRESKGRYNPSSITNYLNKKFNI
mgnify:CR=1 FL=1